IRHTTFSRDWSADVCSSDLGSGDNPTPTPWSSYPPLDSSVVAASPGRLESLGRLRPWPPKCCKKPAPWRPSAWFYLERIAACLRHRLLHWRQSGTSALQPWLKSFRNVDLYYHPNQT